MKKEVLGVLGIIIILSSLFLGCGKTKTSVAYTFKVNTGDSIEIKLDTSEGYSLSSDVPFKISKEGKTLSQGTFITKDTYEQYATSAKNEPKAKIIEESSKNGIEYLMWNYNDSEFNYVIYVKDSNTGIIIGNDVSETVAKDIFSKLTITKK